MKRFEILGDECKVVKNRERWRRSLIRDEDDYLVVEICCGIADFLFFLVNNIKSNDYIQTLLLIYNICTLTQMTLYLRQFHFYPNPPIPYFIHLISTHFHLKTFTCFNFIITFQMNQTITNTTATDIVALQPSSSRLFPVLIVIALLILVSYVAKLKKWKKKPKRQRFAGKTQLFINMNQGKKIRTVPSIHNNKTSYKLGSKTYEIIDYIGDNISKEQVLQQVDQIYAIIHVVDGTEEKTISDAAMFMYKMLVSKDYQKNNCNYIIFLNKKDEAGYLGRVKMEQKLEDEMEHIKQSRISEGEQKESEDDYIKLSKNRFKIPFKIVEGSAESDIKDLQMTLQNF